MNRPKLAALAGAVALMMTTLADAAPITFTSFVQGSDIQSVLGQNNTIGFAYAGDKFVGSVYFGGSNNQLYQTNLNGGGVQKFGTPIPGFSGEIYVSASLGLGGFGARHIFAGSEAAGTVYTFDNAGGNGGVFVSGLAGAVRGIAFDPYGKYGNDMIVTTRAGNVYQVNSSGTATLIASGLGDTEGLDFTPQQFGNIPAGTLVVVSEGTGRLKAIAPDASHTVTDLGVQIAVPEMLSFVPLNLGVSGNPLEGFYAANYPENIIKAGASQWIPYRGDAIITTESQSNGPVNRIFWDETAQVFKTELIGNFPNQPEDGIFVTAAILDPGCTTRPEGCGGGTVPEPGVIALLGATLSGLALSRRRRRS